MSLIEWLIVFYIVAFMFIFVFAMNYPKGLTDEEEGGEDNDHTRKSN